MIAFCAVDGRPSRQRWLGKGSDEPVAQAPDDGAAGGLDGGLDQMAVTGESGLHRFRVRLPQQSGIDDVREQEGNLFADHFTLWIRV